jgi:hypothetical protein
MPRISEVIRVAMERPAASSLAELIRLPVDRRSMAVCRPMLALLVAFCARSAAVLDAMTVIVSILVLIVAGPLQNEAANSQDGSASEKLSMLENNFFAINSMC